MLKDFSGLTKQLFEKPFKNMLFSIYNFADDEFYIHNIRQNGYPDIGIEDLEYMILDTKGVPISEIKSFKYYIEEDIQKNSVIIGVLIYKEKYPVVIKPKSVDVFEVIKADDSG